MKVRAIVGWALPFLLLAGCGDQEQGVQAIVPAIVNGMTITTTHPEVGNVLSNGCTGTLIRSHWFITASHCFYPATAGIDTRGGNIQFTDKNGNIQNANFDVAYRFNTQPDGYTAVNDISLLHLTADIPSSVIMPAKMATSYPKIGDIVQVVGYGCNVRSPPSGSGTKRMATVSWPTNVLCPVDSGGPLFLSDGTLAGINEGEGSATTSDLYGDLVDKKWYVEALIRQYDNNFEFGIDRAGNDYNNFPVTSANACRVACDIDASCRAFSYQIAEQHCWLKSGVMAASFNDDNIAGVPDESVVGYDPIGGDISSSVGTDPNVCHSNCSNTVSPVRCVAWVVDNSTGRCYLKSAVGSVTQVSAATLGIIRTPEQNTNRQGGDLPTHYSNSSVTDCTVRCANNVQCMAWTLAGGTCYLKSIVPDATVASGMQSGFRRGLVFYSDYYGDDLTSKVLPGCPATGGSPFCNPDPGPLLRPQVCQQFCQTTNGCKAWTMDITSSICYLKNGVPPLQFENHPSSVTGTNTTALDW